MVNKVFFEWIGRNIEAYIDYITVKSKRLEQYIEDLNEVFRVLKRHNIKLNLKKYVFGVSSKKFLRFMVS